MGCGEEKEIALIRKREDAHLWIKNVGGVAVPSSKVLVEVEYVKANRTKEKKDMSHFERFVTEGNEKADELTKEGAMMDRVVIWQK